MTGHTRVGSSIPFIASDVQIGMTYTAKLNVDLHVVRQRIAALERKWFQRFSRRMSSVTFGGYIIGPINFYTSVPRDQTSNEITKRRDHLNKHCSPERRRCSMTPMQPDEALGIATQAALLQNA